jgi:endo-1,3(4)-beta-glucanase
MDMGSRRKLQFVAYSKLATPQVDRRRNALFYQAKLLLTSNECRKVLSSPNYENIQYLTTKGYMKGVVGKTWTLTHQLPTITWFPPNSPQQSCLSQLNQTLQYDVDSLAVMVPGDFYYWGGSAARAARLALIAEHIGRNDLVTTVVNILKQSFAYWFDPTHTPGAGYETGWGGFINADGWNNTWVDFGNVRLMRSF